MTSALEQSFKKRLHLIAKERNLTPAEVWQNVITERFPCTSMPIALSFAFCSERWCAVGPVCGYR